MGRFPVRVLAMVAGTAAGLGAPAAAFAAPLDPPGNNGTIKVDGVPFDETHHPDNEPHVDCEFRIDFYGFDEGDLWAEVDFVAHSPTGGGDVPLLHDDVFIGDDPNDGGGSAAGWDATGLYDLSAALAEIEPHEQQGWHVMLTIHADGSQGADTKYKVFWVEGCAAPQQLTPTTVTIETPTTTPTTPTTAQTGAVLGAQVQRTPAEAAAAAPAAEVAGAEQGRVLARTGPAGGTLFLTLLGVGLVLAGQAVRLAARRS
jgi:hypothetical protein